MSDEIIPPVAARVPAPPAVDDGELSDEELEHVVGGLTRPWTEPVLPWEPTLP